MRATLWCILVGFLLAGCHRIDVGRETELRYRSTLLELVESGAFPATIAAGEAERRALEDTLRELYRKRDGERIWTAELEPTAAGRALLEVIRNAAGEGLSPAAYGLESIENALAELGPASIDPALAVAELELAMSSAFFLLAAHQNGGRVDLRSLKRRSLDRAQLQSFAARFAGDPGPADLFDPSPDRDATRARELITIDRADYRLLREHYINYRALAARGEPIPEGIVETLAINLERRRVLPRELGKRHVLIDLTTYVLELYEDGEPVQSMRVIIGKRDRATPELFGELESITFNPTWHVPEKLATRDLLPQIKKDPHFLSDRDFRVFRKIGGETEELDPQEIDWEDVAAEEFEFALLQEPGPENALGRVKFSFPNGKGIYLHDTPQIKLFEKEVREFSAGCVRVEDPRTLAHFLLADDPEWPTDAIDRALSSDVTRKISLKTPVPVYLVYWTARAQADGSLSVREDIYRRDPKLARALGLAEPAQLSAR